MNPWKSFVEAALVRNGALLVVLHLSASCLEARDTDWRPVEQPELKQALEKAPRLQTESLGEPARGVNVWERWLVPNPDGKSWDVLQLYFKSYYESSWLYAIDLGTGEVKKQRLPDGRQFYLSGTALALDGKFYMTTPANGMCMHTYDPATNTFEDRGCIRPHIGGEVRPIACGPDGVAPGLQFALHQHPLGLG